MAGISFDRAADVHDATREPLLLMEKVFAALVRVVGKEATMQKPGVGEFVVENPT